MSALFSKLTLIQSQLRSIPESGRNTFHNYRYATAEDIINAVRPICSEHGVFISITCNEYQILKEGKAASVVITLTAIDAESGESTSCTMPGYAEDSKSDKSLWKAITGASKYCLRAFFCLATTDDPELEDSPQQQTNNGNVKAALIEQTTTEMRRVGWSIENGKAYVQQAFDKSSRKQLTEEELQQFLDYLRSLPMSVA